VLSLLPSPLDLFAIIFGILLTMRKLDVAHRQPSQHPSVGAADFELWQRAAMSAYGLGIWACFLKLVVDFAGRYLFGALQPSKAVAMTVGIGLDLVWVAVLLLTWRRVQRAHALAERVGVEAPRGLSAGS
jgi:hypothetical protein